YLDTVASPVDAALGRYTRRVIYENGRFVRVEDADGNTVASQTHQSSDFTGTRTDALGNITRLLYDRRGNILEETTPDGHTAKFEYADSTNPDKETAFIDNNGNRTEISYDRNGNPVSILDAAGNRRDVTYDAGNRPTSLVLRNTGGAPVYSVTAGYDARGNLTRFVNCAGQERTLAYDAQGRPTEIKEFDQTVSLLTYDGTANTAPSSVVTSEGKVQEFVYNSANRLTTAKAPDGSTLAFTYDAKGQIIRRTDANGGSASFTYDGLGNITRVTDRNGNITEMTYDSENRVVREAKLVTDNGNYADDLVTSIIYDVVGRTTSITDPLGKTTSYEYTPGGRVSKKTDSAGRETLYTYDPNGNVTGITDRNGRKRTFEYDYRNLMTREQWFAPGGGPALETFTFSYNEQGKPTRLTGGGSILSYEYACGNLSRFHNTGSTGIPLADFAITSTPGGLTASITDHTGAAVLREYDDDGNLFGLTWSGGGLPGSSVSYQKDGFGFTERISRFSDIAGTTGVSVSKYERIPFEGTVLGIRHERPDGSLIDPGADFRYVYDPDQRLTSLSGQGNTTQFTYGKFGEVTAAAHSAGAYTDESYQYDKLGNRTNSHLGGTSPVNAVGLPASDQQWDYVYDSENNRIRQTHRVSGNIRTYQYDHRNRITSVRLEQSGGATLGEWVFRYDPLDRLIARTVNGTSTFTSYWEDNPWADSTADGTVLTRYLHDDTMDGLVARWDPATGVEWIHADALQSVRYTTNDSGAVMASVTYDSFGNAIAGETHLARLRYGFTGREHLGMGLYHLRQRVLDSTTGRFLSDDPLGYGGEDFNLQRYAYNNPLRFVDPQGTISISVPELSTVTSIQISMGSRGVIATFTVKAWAVNAVAGAVFAPMLDIICLAVTDDLERLTVGRILRQAFIGGVGGGLTGKLAGSLGKAGALAQIPSAIASKLPWSMAALGTWINNASSLAWGATAGRLGFRAALGSNRIIESGLNGDSSGCDSFFYTVLGGD
ncbi:MAG: RHS repeat protein, partial [Verrucomicrobiaceae bacterium]